MSDSSSPTSAALRILAAEDDSLGARLLSMFLQRLGHEAVVVDGGIAATAAAVSQPFDVMLLDIEMPDQDGWTTLTILRHSGIVTPAIALTGHAAPGDRERILEHGFNGYLAKPLRLSQLQEELALVHRAGLSRPGAPTFDGQHLAQEMGIDQETVALLLRAFLGSSAQDAVAVQQALDNADGAELQQRVHRLRGSLGSLGQHGLVARATRIEQYCRAGKPEQGLAETPAFLQAFDQFVQAARHWLEHT